MSSSRLISCRCFFRRIERALLSLKHILSFALTPRVFCHQILTLGKLWARLCERIRWWANDFVCSFQKLALRCPICRCREGHGRGERAVALDQFFQFSHIANASFGHHSEGNQNFPRLPRGGFAGALYIGPAPLREKSASLPFNVHALHRIPATPAANQCQELAFPSPDRHDIPNGARYPRTSDECLISERRFNLGEVG